MKKIFAVMLVVLCSMLSIGCTNTRNTLIENASPDTSALAVYCYDGHVVTRGFIFNQDEIEEILEEISKVEADELADWSPAMLGTPIYGLEIGGVDGTSITAAWSSGYWIAQDGTVYSFVHDMETLLNSYEWESQDTWYSTSILPCARYLSVNESGWDSTMLTPAGELTAPSDISMVLIEQTEDTLTVELSNTGTEEWCYGEYFSIQVLIDGTWYEVPVQPGDWAFNDIVHILQAGDTQTQTYDLTMYGELPVGNYRLVVENLVVEFEIK